MDNPVIKGNARFTVFFPGVIRLEYALKAKFSQTPSIICPQELPFPDKSLSVKIKQKGKLTQISTSLISLKYMDTGEPFNRENLIIESALENDGFSWKPGQQADDGFSPQFRSLDTAWGENQALIRHRSANGFLNHSGYQIIDDQARIYWNDDLDWAVSKSREVVQDWYFFLYGRDYLKALKYYIAIFGSAPLLPKWAFGLMFCPQQSYQDDVIELVKKFQRELIPLDVLLFDNTWKKNNPGGYDWDLKKYKDPVKLLNQIKQMGIRVALMDCPGFDYNEPLPGDDSRFDSVRKLIPEPPYKGSWACDWSRKSVVNVWLENCLKPVLENNIDFFWLDGWGDEPFIKADSQFWLNFIFSRINLNPQLRKILLSRFGGIGSHRYSCHFSGHIGSDWQTLKQVVFSSIHAAPAGLYYWAHAVGGCLAKKLPEEFYIRWLQFAAFNSLFYFHGFFGNREPWLYNLQLKNVFKKYIHFRYALIPYIYHYAYMTYKTGVPLIRAMYLAEPKNEVVYQFQYQFYFGNDLLLFPVTGKIKNGHEYYLKKAYFPSGEWLEIEEGQTVLGPCIETIKIPLDRIPVYVRKGAIIPYYKVALSLETAVPESIFFDIFPDDNNSFELYEDDGESEEYRNGKFFLTKISVIREYEKINVKIIRTDNDYSGKPETRNYFVNIRLDDTLFELKKVYINGKPLLRQDSITPHNNGFIFTNLCAAGTIKSKLAFCLIFVYNVKEELTISVQ